MFLMPYVVLSGLIDRMKVVMFLFLHRVADRLLHTKRTLHVHHLMHGGAMVWLVSSFAHEWSMIGQADLAFLVLAVICELDHFMDA